MYSVAVMPLKVMLLIPSRLVPFIVTSVPIGPEDGLMFVIEGAGIITVKLVWADPPRVVITKLPWPTVAPTGTFTEICVALTRVYSVAFWPLMVMLWKFSFSKFLPLTVISVPIGPEVGVIEVMVGAGMIVKELPDVVECKAFLTVIGPVIDPVGTLTVILLSFTTVKLLLGLLEEKRTSVVLIRLEP
nr:hypothetical protein [Rufibacter hautae]